MMTSHCDIGVAGLGVMGRNLVRNMAGHGLSVAVFERMLPVMEKFLAEDGRCLPVCGCRSLAELIEHLSRPRKLMLMVTAGKPVDDLIGQLVPLLDRGDIIIDGGNSDYRDTMRRTRLVERHGLRFMGVGVSGGAGGALTGPAIMAGGLPEAWPDIRELFNTIAAKTPAGEPSCGWVGDDGAGHFVKMVHNAIEYADMQLIAEAADILDRGIGLDADEAADVFSEWNHGELESYLTGITAVIMRKRDEVTGALLLDMILDAAGQKGTGQWAVTAALELEAPAPTIAEAVFARYMSARKDERVWAAGMLPGPAGRFTDIGRDDAVAVTEQALYAAKICSYAQGFQLMAAASAAYEWGLDYAGIARVWRTGCIVSGALLDHIAETFEREPDLQNLILAPLFRNAVDNAQDAWRHLVALAARHGIPAPAVSSALAWYDSYRSGRLPANLVQAQRDYFGAHGYERIDCARGELFHSDWSGER